MIERNNVYADSQTQVEFEKFLQSIIDGELLDDLETRELSEEETREAMEFNELLDNATEVRE